MSVGDIDNDGEYEYFVSGTLTNFHDACRSRGYTGRCFIDCSLDGTLVWRLDIGQNIRAGAPLHPVCVQLQRGRQGRGGCQDRARHRDDPLCAGRHRAVPPVYHDAAEGWTPRYSHADNYVCARQDYRLHMAEVFRRWHTHPEVVNGRWPARWSSASALRRNARPTPVRG